MECEVRVKPGFTLFACGNGVVNDRVKSGRSVKKQMEISVGEREGVC